MSCPARSPRGSRPSMRWFPRPSKRRVRSLRPGPAPSVFPSRTPASVGVLRSVPPIPPTPVPASFRVPPGRSCRSSPMRAPRSGGPSDRPTRETGGLRTELRDPESLPPRPRPPFRMPGPPGNPDSWRGRPTESPPGRRWPKAERSRKSPRGSRDRIRGHGGSRESPWWIDRRPRGIPDRHRTPRSRHRQSRHRRFRHRWLPPLLKSPTSRRSDRRRMILVLKRSPQIRDRSHPIGRGPRSPPGIVGRTGALRPGSCPPTGLPNPRHLSERPRSCPQDVRPRRFERSASGPGRIRPPTHGRRSPMARRVRRRLSNPPDPCRTPPARRARSPWFRWPRWPAWPSVTPNRPGCPPNRWRHPPPIRCRTSRRFNHGRRRRRQFQPDPGTPGA